MKNASPRLVPVVCATLLLAAGCEPSLVVPDGAQITCTADSECPSDYRCNGDTGLCAHREQAPPESRPSLALPEGQTAVKPGDALVVAGTCEEGAVVTHVSLVNPESGTEVQALPPTTVACIGGALSGTFVTGALAHGAAVALEVVVQARGFLSEAAASRSLPVQVDAEAPGSTQLSVPAAAAGGVGTLEVTLALSAIDAAELFLDGDLEDAATVRTWIPYQTSVEVRLSEGDGPKVILARFRDEAFNDAQVSTSISLSTAIPVSAPQLQGPHHPLQKVRNAETLLVSGSASPGTLIHSGLLMAVDGASAPLPGEGCAVDVTSQLTIGPGGNLGGSFNLGTPCTGAAGVLLELRVRNPAGTLSVAAESRTAVLALDNQPPAPATAAYLLATDAQPGFSRSQTVTLVLDAERDGTTELLIEGAVQPSARTLAWVPFPASSGVPGEEQVTLTAGDGPKEITVRFRDEVGNESVPVNLTLTLDLQAPPAPTAVTLRLQETSPAPDDPAQIADGNDVFTLTGLSGAIVNGDRVRIYSDPVLTQQVTELTADGNGGFGPVVLPYVAGESWYLTALDPAGNVSTASTRVAVPQLSAFTAGPVPARAGVAVTIAFTSDVSLQGSPTVTVDGHPASCGAPAGLTYSCSYVPAGTEAQGLDAAVIRVAAHDGTGTFAAGTVGTQAILHTFDFLPPTLDEARVVVTQADPGSADTLSALEGAVADGLDAPDQVTVRVYAEDGVTLLPGTAGLATAAGAFGPLALGDNAHAGVVVRLTDRAGNESAGAAFANDVLAPGLASLLGAPSAQREGQDVVVTFDVTDAAHDLRAAPVVTVAGNPATLESGTLATSDGLVHPFTYRYTVQGTDAEQSHPVAVTVTDAVGNVRAGSTSVLIDRTAPTSVNTTPGNRASWNGSPGILGTAQDGLSGLDRVEVSLRSVTSGQWWSGTGFDAAAEVWRVATGTSTWSFDTAGIPFAAGQDYQLRWRAVDVAGNAQTPAGTWTYTHDANLPAAPASLTAAPNGEATIELSWTAVPGATGYKVYYDVEGTAAPPYAGLGAQAPSPIAVAAGVTALTVTGLPRGRHVFAVTAEDGASESGYSAQASAPSRYWKWSQGSVSANWVARLVSTGPGQFVGVGAGGTVWLSSDAGATWTLRAAAGVGDLLDVVVAGGALVAAGTKGITRSLDGGHTWSFVRSITTSSWIFRNWKLLHASGANVVAATSGGVLYSADAGASFAAATTPLVGAPRMLLGEGDNVIVFGSGSATRTVNAGATWGTVTLPSSTGAYNIGHLSGQVGVVGGDVGLLVRTTDGGATWVNATGSGMSSEIRLVMGVGSTVFVAETNGGVASTQDGGATWSTTFNLPIYLTGGWTDGTVAMMAGESNGHIRTEDGGATWTQVGMPPGTSGDFRTSTMASDGAVIVAGGEAGLARSLDLGLSFTQSPRLGFGSTVWAAGDDVVTFSGKDIQRSHDGAESWAQTLAPGGVSSLELVGGDGTALVAVGRLGGVATLLRSVDAGRSFSTVASLPGASGVFKGITVSGSTWVAVTDQGYVVRSVDGGLSWPEIDRPVTTALNGVMAISSGFLAYGNQGVVLRSTNDGADWTPTPPLTGAGLISGRYASGQIILVNAGSTTLLWSNDEGVTFEARNPGGGGNALWFDGANILVGGGGNTGRIYRSPDSGLTWSLVYTGPMVNAATGFQGFGEVDGRFYAFGTGQPVYSDGAGAASTWSPLPLGWFADAPVGPQLQLTNAWTTGRGMPFVFTRAGTLALGPP